MAERRIGVLTTTGEGRTIDVWRALRLLVGAIALTFGMINVHEIGRTLAVRLAGDPHGSPSFWGRLIVSVAGVLATQLVAVAALLLARLTGRRPSLAALGVVFVVFVLGDAADQTVQGLTASVATQTGLTNVDFADALYLLHAHWQLSVGVLKVLLAVVTAVWVALIGWATFVWLGPAPTRRLPRARRNQPVIAARPGGWKS